MISRHGLFTVYDEKIQLSQHLTQRREYCSAAAVILTGEAAVLKNTHVLKFLFLVTNKQSTSIKETAGFGESAVKEILFKGSNGLRGTG